MTQGGEQNIFVSKEQRINTKIIDIKLSGGIALKEPV